MTSSFYTVSEIDKNIILIYQNASIQRSKHPQLRWGQAVFNSAYDFYPEEVNQLRNTEFDCFYADEKTTEFMNQLGKILEDKNE